MTDDGAPVQVALREVEVEVLIVEADMNGLEVPIEDDLGIDEAGEL